MVWFDMRLFIAIEVPEDIKEMLEELVKKICDTGESLKLVDDFHLTLEFLGEVDEQKKDKIVKELCKISNEKFSLLLDRIGFFPNNTRISVVWLGVQPHEKICALQSKVLTSMNQLGFTEDKNFHPHLTLARVKSISAKNEFVDKLNGFEIKKASFEVDSFNLIKSTLTPKGPIYDVLASFKLV
jgi:RNA 2',3'-cyclic 3'-phosphodiesterase